MNRDNLYFKFGQLLGEGNFGKVYLGTKINSNKILAIKQLDRQKIDYSIHFKYMINEINILSSLNHPNILKFDSWAISENHYYIATEYLNGGDLSDCLVKYIEKYNTPFNEEITQHIMKQILEAIKYLHSKKIAHRDLKLANIMVNFDTLEDKAELNMLKSKVKIIDFGLSKHLDKNNLLDSLLGTMINADPIIVKGFQKKMLNEQNEEPHEYNEKCDIWSIGTICYEMMVGKPLFDVDDLDELVEKINEEKIEIPPSFSNEIISFLNSMLKIDNKLRSSAQKLLYHDFIKKDFSNDKRELEHKEVEKEIQHNNKIISNLNNNNNNNNVINNNKSEDIFWKKLEEFKKIYSPSKISYYKQSMS